MNKMLCPDCGAPFKDHNAVNDVPGGLIAHSRDGGACWRSLNSPFTEQLLLRLTILAAGMSKTDLAFAIGVSRQTVYNWIREASNQ